MGVYLNLNAVKVITGDLDENIDQLNWEYEKEYASLDYLAHLFLPRGKGVFWTVFQEYSRKGMIDSCTLDFLINDPAGSIDQRGYIYEYPENWDKILFSPEQILTKINNIRQVLSDERVWTISLYDKQTSLPFNEIFKPEHFVDYIENERVNYAYLNNLGFALDSDKNDDLDPPILLDRFVTPSRGELLKNFHSRKEIKKFPKQTIQLIKRVTPLEREV